MKISIHKNFDEMSRAAADLLIAQVKGKPASVICIPSGDSPSGMFRRLIADVNTGRIDLNQCTFVGLDEWVGLGKGDDGSCTTFLYENFFDPLQIRPEKIKLFNARAADLDAECAAMDGFIAANGPLDMMIVGIGMNGHIGLNEPGTDVDLYAHHAPLAEMTITVGQKYFKQQTQLHEGITLGLKHLQEAKTPVLLVSGAKKAAVVKQALQGEVTNNMPASIFQTLDNAIVFLDEDAAGELVDQ